MKNKKSIKQKFSEFGVILFILAGMFFFFKSRWNSKKQVTEPVVAEVIQQDDHRPPVEEKTPVESPEAETPVQNTQVKFEEVKSTSIKKPDPLLVNITNFYNDINEKYEQRLREMFKGEQKEELMDKYLALRQERALRMRDLLKTDNSRAANVKVNYDYHNKLYQIVGKELYVKYLKILKETNDNAKRTKIIMEF